MAASQPRRKERANLSGTDSREKLLSRLCLDMLTCQCRLVAAGYFLQKTSLARVVSSSGNSFICENYCSYISVCTVHALYALPWIIGVATLLLLTWNPHCIPFPTSALRHNVNCLSYSDKFGVLRTRQLLSCWRALLVISCFTLFWQQTCCLNKQHAHCDHLRLVLCSFGIICGWHTTMDQVVALCGQRIYPQVAEAVWRQNFSGRKIHVFSVVK